MDGSGYAHTQDQYQNQNQGELEVFDYINESRYASAATTPLGGPSQFAGQANQEPWNRQVYHEVQQHQHQQQQPTRQQASNYNPQDSGASLFVPFAQQRAGRGTSSIQGYSPEPLSAKSTGQRTMQDHQQEGMRNAQYPPRSDGPSSHFSGSTSPNPIFSQNGQGRIQPSSLSHYQQSSYEGQQQHAAPSNVHPINAGFGLPLAQEGAQAVYAAPYPQHASQHPQTQARAPQSQIDGPSDSTGPTKKQKKVEIDHNDAEPGRPVVPPPVKNACLSCRTKKARCDGVQPICTQCSSKGRECVYVKSRRGGARRRKDKSLSSVPPPPPSALKEFLARLDGLQAPGGEPPELDGLSMTSGAEGGAAGAVDPATAVRSYAPDDLDGM